MMLELPDPIDLRSSSDQRTYTTDAQGRHLFGVYENIRTRPPSGITGICCHQTACYMGEKPARYLSTGAHRVVTRGGEQLWLHDSTDRIVSANGFNARCVSIEGDGIYAGVEGDPRTVWDDPTTKVRESAMDLPDAFVAAYRETIRAIVREVAAKGGAIKFILCHRQSSGTRQNDPGQGIYQQVVRPMLDELGLSNGGAGFKIDDGRAIPEVWDERAKGVRY
jgi:hypothetical protein